MVAKEGIRQKSLLRSDPARLASGSAASKLGHDARHNERMDNTREQAAKLYDALFPHLNFLFRLKTRCEQLPADDRLHVAAAAAYEAAWELSREAHSRSTRMG